MLKKTNSIGVYLNICKAVDKLCHKTLISNYMDMASMLSTLIGLDTGYFIACMKFFGTVVHLSGV